MSKYEERVGGWVGCFFSPLPQVTHPPTHLLTSLSIGRLDPGVSLYSRKVLIESKCGRILPDWMVSREEEEEEEEEG